MHAIGVCGILVPVCNSWSVDQLISWLKEVRVVISMMLPCDASVIEGYGRRRSRFGNAAISRKYDNYSCHRDHYTALALNTQNSSCLVYVRIA